MRRFLPLSLLIILTVSLLARSSPAADSSLTFPLKDGDIWVMAGDSITAQHLHSNYFEAFCYARYPKLKFAFRNSGVGGHTIPTTLARFDYDIAAWQPTVVSVELGMNDKGGTPTDSFIKNMGTMTARIRGIKARPVILAASPVNNGETMDKLNGNKRLSEYAIALKGFCEKEEIPYADQFHALVDVWGKNKPLENIANTLNTIRALAADDGLTGVEHLRAFLAEQQKHPTRAVSMLGDAVHPGAPGQLMMAAALLKRLGAEGFVSSATISSSGEGEVKGCTVSDVKAGDGKLAFDRLDDCLPFPIPNDARAVLVVAPEVLELSQYTLKVTGLKDADYVLSIDGARCARLTAKQLADGVNLTAITTDPLSKTANPIVSQMQAVLAAVAAKEGIVGMWRGLSAKAHAKGADPKLMDDLAALTKNVEAADAKIREAAKPKKLHFEIEPAK
jgi:lysophospholipase L1-like esterase